MEYVIKKGNVKLGGFFPNALPCYRYNNKKQCWTISAKDIFLFSNNNYNIYNSYEEAKESLLYMLHTIHENAERYNDVHYAGEESCLRIWQKLKIHALN